MCAACYLASYSVSPPNSKLPWFARATDDERCIYMDWIKMANFRASQTGMCYSILIQRKCKKFVSFVQCICVEFYGNLFVLRYGSRCRFAYGLADAMTTHYLLLQ